MRKIPQTFTLDQTVITALENQADKEQRSKSHIVNETLKKSLNVETDNEKKQ
jgi:predicted transcriptional regulator